MLRVIIILVMLVQMSDCVECRIFQSISPWAATNVTAQYCTFVMPPPCTNLEYSEDEVLRYQHFKTESCMITVKKMLLCACFSDYCSSDHKKIKAIWLKSKDSKTNPQFTKCLDGLISANKSTPSDNSLRSLSGKDEKKKGKRKKKHSPMLFSFSTLANLLFMIVACFIRD
uniref:Expressed conserved protein n=1 Tax=Haemonchus contortus TaxID=6289 RepID=A0A7I4Y5E0_HAECO